MSRHSHAGIAMMQVLLITMVLALLGLFITNSARQQLNYASGYKAKAEAFVQNYDIQSQILFALLLEPRIPGKKINVSGLSIVELWNDYGEPFEVDKYTKVTLQDLRGTLDLNYPDKSRLTQVLNYFGVQEYEAMSVFYRLVDWQDGDMISQYNTREQPSKNGVMQSKDELSQLKLGSEVEHILYQYTSIYKDSGFNYLAAPDDLLLALNLGNAQEQVIVERKLKELTSERFTQLTGISEGDGIILYPSNSIRIKIETVVDDARVVNEYILKLSPNKKEPVKAMGFRSE